MKKISTIAVLTIVLTTALAKPLNEVLSDVESQAVPSELSAEFLACV